MQKILNFEEPFRVNGHYFSLRRIVVDRENPTNIYMIFYVFKDGNFYKTISLIEDFHCNSQNIYYIRRKARQIIKNYIRSKLKDKLND